MAAPITLEAIVAEIQKLQTQVGTPMAQLQQQAVQEVPQFQQAAGAMDQLSIDANLEVSRAEAAREATKQLQIQQGIRRLGLDITDPNSQSGQLALDLDRQQQELRMMAADMSELNSVGFLDNPVQWLLNQVSLEFKKGQFQQLGQQASTTAGLLQQRAAIGRDHVQTVLATNEAKTQTEIEAAQQAAVMGNYAKLMRNKIADATNGTAALKELYNTGMESVKAKTQIYQMYRQDQEDKRQAALQNLALQREKLQFDEIKKRIKSATVYEQMLGNTYKQIYGKAVPEGMPVEVLEKDPILEEAFFTLNAAGTFSADPYSAVQVAKAAGHPVSMPWHRRVVEFIDSIPTEMRKMAAGDHKQLTEKELAAQLPEASMKRAKADVAGDMDSSKLHGMFPLQTYGNQPDLKNTTLWKKILSKYDTTQTVTAEGLAAHAAQLVTAKELTAPQAARELQTFMKAHQFIVNEAVGMRKFALPQMTRALIKLTAPTGIFGSRSAVAYSDLLNLGGAERAVQHYLMQVGSLGNTAYSSYSGSPGDVAGAAVGNVMRGVGNAVTSIPVPPVVQPLPFLQNYLER